jgi:hypothetical protein
VAAAAPEVHHGQHGPVAPHEQLLDPREDPQRPDRVEARELPMIERIAEAPS